MNDALPNILFDVAPYATSSLVFDTLEKIGIKPKVLDLSIKPLQPHSKVFGAVFTLKGISNVSDQQKKDSRAFFDVLTPGSVILIETGGGAGVGHWGELMSYGALSKGVQGVVYKGGCRDSIQVSEIQMPVFCEYTSPYESGSEYCIGSWQHPIEMPGINGAKVNCSPGDYVIADADGAVIIDGGKIRELLDKLIEVYSNERAAINDILSGVNVNEAFIKNGVV